jgi:hypothetical protein
MWRAAARRPAGPAAARFAASLISFATASTEQRELPMTLQSPHAHVAV